MGRPCEYDEERALDGAMLVFWQKGFGGTSITDLEQATGMKRQSLYNAFGDKLELFARVLGRYRDKGQQLVAPLRRPDATLLDIRQNVLVNLGTQKKHECGACMVIKAAFDPLLDDPEIRRVVKESALNTQRLYRDVLKREQQRGRIDPALDPDALAQYLFCVLNGLSVLAQTGGTTRDVERALDLALDHLPRPPKRRRKAVSSGAPHN